MITLLISCTEKYELTAANYESLLVVEATITDEMGAQEIKLSKTIPLNSDEPIYVNNAQVSVEDGNQNTYMFTDSGMGVYRSNQEFKTIEGLNYMLHITTEDGKKYSSNSEIAPAVSEIEELHTRLSSTNGADGIQVLVNSTIGEAKYFKYDYEETYQVVPPYYTSLDFSIDNIYLDYDVSPSVLTFNMLLLPKEEDVSVCYSNNYSTEIMQTSLVDIGVNAVVDFPVRFIKADDGIIRDRYSIMVIQSVQSLDAYNFYMTLKKLGITENLFTENQPGFIQGNMNSIDDPDENVFGFFQATSISRSRIFFDFSDFSLPAPPYLYECEFYEEVDYRDNTTLDLDRNDRLFIYNSFKPSEPPKLRYFEGTDPVFTFITPACGDCSVVSSTLKPDFWED